MKLVRRFASVGFLTLASVVLGYFGPAARGNAAGADLDAFITKALKEYQVPGAAVLSCKEAKWFGSGIFTRVKEK
jgi:hypothetical protein